MSYDFPRRNRVDQWSVGERAIQDAVDVVEGMGADVRLTNAVVLLGKARDAVADFVDGVQPASDDGGFCTECGHKVESFEGLKGCPACGTDSVPCVNKQRVTVSINWHELRILAIWAENYQRSQRLGRTVYAIAKRLEAQHPSLGALTLAREIGELAKAFGEVSVSSADLRRDIAEQTGEETGLIGGVSE